MTRFTHKADQDFGLDEIILNDLKMLIKIKSILKSFYITTKRLKDNAIKKHHGILWKVVIGLEYLIQLFQD